MRLGEILLQEGIVDVETLERALSIQQKSGAQIGDVLIALGKINPLQLAKALSLQFNLPYRNAVDYPANPETLKEVVLVVGEQFLRTNAILPLGRKGNALGVVTSRPNAKEPLEALAKAMNAELFLFVCSEREIQTALTNHFRDSYTEESTMGLFFRNPEESAMETFTTLQLVLLYSLVTLFLFGMLFRGRETLLVLFFLINVFYVFSLGFKLLASILGARTEILEQVSDEEAAALDPKTLPVYTILLPMYKEPEVVKHLIAGIMEMDYPLEKLDVKILLEEEDTVTYDAVRALRPPANFEIVRVPYSVPKTKPKACNYGLLFARGEYLTIYDAEDVPEKDQLRKVVAAFRKGPENMICVQAALNYFNSDQNLLTRMFTLEYSYWFDYMLPGIEALGMPIPLGGTSNHFRTEMLRLLGGWDPFNVTEDADLGIRASAHRMWVSTINSTTFEEANSHTGNWIRQRSRWIKGYMQTYLVHMRNPLRLFRTIGLMPFLGVQLLIGGTFMTFLINPILWLLFIFWIAFRPLWMESVFPLWILTLSTLNLIVGNAMGIYLNMLAVFRRRLFHLTFYSLMNPFYWILHSIAAYKALWQLFTKPFFWEKTVHGLAKK
ncbi:MAG: glycosyltransferase [Synergistaceae bacterium]|nr:glycosyltransferase [Synergistaceae bacterium]NLD96518.1 glycosyltransferase [Synergistaceae bacterium]